MKNAWFFMRKDNGLTPPRWVTLTIITLCALLCAIQLYVGHRTTIYHDGPSYFNAWEALKLLHPHEMRPPFYTLIVGLLTEIFGQPIGLSLLLALQWICYTVALLLLYQLCRRIGVGQRMANFVTIGVLFLPGMWVLNNWTLAESISGSMVVALVWLLMRFHDTHSSRWLIMSGMLLWLLVFTKPVYIILIPIVAIFWWITRCNRRQVLTSVCILGLLIGSLAFYAWQISRFYNGNFALSRAPTDNMYYCLREDGIIIPDEIPVDSIRRVFAPLYEADPGRHAPAENLYGGEAWGGTYFSWDEKKLIISTALKNHPGEALAGTWKRFEDAATFSQTFYPEPWEAPDYHTWVATPKSCTPFFFPFGKWLYTPVWLTWLALLIYFGILAVAWRRQHKMPLIRLTIGIILFAGMFTSIAGAEDSWGRLMTPFNLMLVPIAGYLLQQLSNNVNRIIRK